MMYKELYEKAKEVLPRAYAPFSKFKVGAALLSKDGEVFTGVNVENSSFGGTICAERTAFVKAVSEGVYEFEAIAVVSSDGQAWPCGICRQFMKEFCDDDFKIITGDNADELSVYTMDEILPEGFRL
ncbi:MAG: cytidine deaminase [Firmicutes bacterium]|jgi:cytidine deaminase|nr:cytidine deaminase [Bacillota bacterium]